MTKVMARKEFTMNDKQKQKYAELFITALDTMEAGKYQMPWVSAHHGSPANYEYRKPYKGMNDFLLTLLCSLKGYETPFFLTFKQIEKLELELNLRKKDGLPLIDETTGCPKSENSFPVVKSLPTFYLKGKRLTPKEYDELSDEEKEECKVWFNLHAYPEFNLDQTNFREKYPEKWEKLTALPPHDYVQGTKDEVLEAMICGGKWRCEILFGGNEAYFSPKEDHIRLPERSRFLGDERFYAAAIHEMAHSTAKECGRSEKGVFGDENYAIEEFVAELTAASVCSMLGLGKLLDKNHIAYVQSWRKALREDKDVIPKVIDHIQKATNYILRYYDKVRKELHPLALPLAA